MRASLIGSLLLGIACEPPGGALEITASPTAIPPDGTRARIRIIATRGAGKIGTGVVKLTASTGTVEPAIVILDAFGTGSAEVWCDLGTDCHRWV
jgi:hypothetical protein